MASSDEIIAHFERQAGNCGGLGSPFTARLCRTLLEVLDETTEFGDRILNWPGDPVADALALRAAGALNALAHSGLAPGLASIWPPAEAKLDAPLKTAIRTHDQWLAPWLDSPPQTNEVARSGVLLGGCLEVARRTGLPLELLEIGASVGLNLHLDAWTYDLGAAGRWGAANAPVGISSDWRGTPPDLAAPLNIIARAGADLAPLDAADPEARARMLAYIWADQAERRARAEAALLHAARSGVVVTRANAADWARAQLAAPQAEGTARVFLHSIMWQYMPEATRADIRATLAKAGTRATKAAPLAWLRMEAEGRPEYAVIRLTLWPGGETQVIGHADYHGRWAEWGPMQDEGEPLP